MKKFEWLKVEREEGILIVTLNNPEKLNVLTTKIISELRDAIQEVYDNSEITGVIITGTEEKTFAAGADVREIANLNELNGRKFSENGQEAFALIESCHKPILAAVNGDALGAGCELALACHLRIASENAVFGLPEASIGIIPGFGGTQRLTQLIGKARALELMITAEKLTATEAQQIGLVNHVVKDPEALVVRSKNILKKIIANGPIAIGMLINCVNAVCNPCENGYQTEANSFANCCKTEDFKEGSTAVFEKRKPQFKGS